jgi:hypothetical protein
VRDKLGWQLACSRWCILPGKVEGTAGGSRVSAAFGWQNFIQTTSQSITQRRAKLMRAELQTATAVPPRSRRSLNWGCRTRLWALSLAGLYLLSVRSGASKDVTYQGKYVFTTHNLSSGVEASRSEAEFAFGQKRGDWMLEVFQNPSVTGLERIRWVFSQGVLYRTEFASSEKPGLIPRIMAITTNTLPDFGWHCALPMLLVFVPEQVLESTPPSIPRTTFLPYEPGLPARMWCQVDALPSGAPFINLRVYGERSPTAKQPDTPTEPRDPLLMFECRVVRFVTVRDALVPVEFYFRACYPRGTASPEDVTTTWDVKGIVDQKSISTDVPELFKLEGKTLVVDQRVPLADGSFASYYSTNTILGSNSPQIERMRRERAAVASAANAPSSKRRVVVAIILLSSSLFIISVTRPLWRRGQKTAEPGK